MGDRRLFDQVMAGFFPTFFHQFWSQGSDPTTRLQARDGNGAPPVAVAPRPFPRRNPISRAPQGLPAVLALIGRAGHRGPCAGSREGAGPGHLVCDGHDGLSGAKLFSTIRLLLRSPRRPVANRVSAYGIPWLSGRRPAVPAHVLMTLHPACLVWLDGRGRAVPRSYVAVWWLVFSLPFASGCRTSGTRFQFRLELVGAACDAQGRRATHAVAVLLAYWLYIWREHDRQMAVDYGLASGFPPAVCSGTAADPFVAFPGRWCSAGWRTDWRPALGSGGPVVYLGVTVGRSCCTPSDSSTRWP